VQVENPNAAILTMLPEIPSSPAQLTLLALSCDTFHATKGICFLSDFALDEFIHARVKIAGDRFGSKFWQALRSAHPLPPSSRQRRGRRLRVKPFSIFSCPRSSLSNGIQNSDLYGFSPCVSPCSTPSPAASFIPTYTAYTF